MWPREFADRLDSWNQLRTNVRDLPAEQALDQINRWWFECPWKPYYLHWDDQSTWPDPWQLLSDNIYCDLARGLGILYTITMIEHPDLGDAELVLTDQGDNLVLVSKRKYILNWDAESIVNNNSNYKTTRQYQQQQAKQQYL